MPSHRKTRSIGQWLALAGAVVWAMSFSTLGDYLPRVGPPPLRFISSSQGAGQPAVLPPLVMADPTPPVAQAAPPVPVGPQQTSPAQLEAATEELWHALSDPNAAGIIPPAAPPESAGPDLSPGSADAHPANSGAAIVPQSLLRFFSSRPQGTNGLDTAIALPPSIFQPPAERSAAGSSATYTTR